MWYLVLTLASTVWLVAPAFPQFMMFNMSSKADATSVTMTIDLSAGPTPSATSGAPYSGRQTMKTVETLADGTRLTRESPMETRTYRDSMGRVRMERAAFPVVGGLRQPASFTLVEIQDPVAGYRYLLDSVNRVVHRVPAQFRAVRAATAANPVNEKSSTHTMPDGTTITSEPLGTQVMFGVTVAGVRRTLTYPTGSRMGNDRPFSAVTETWGSPQLGVTLLSKSVRPGTESTTTWEDFSAAEPDPALFMIPSDYQVVDETGPFRIVVPREKDAR